MHSPQRRHFSRIGFHAGARLSVGDVEHGCEVLDLSLKGALIELPPGVHPAPGTRCRLEIALETDGPVIRIEGDVVHAEGERVGLACREIDLDSITHLRRLLELNLGDPQLLQRELGTLAGG